MFLVHANLFICPLTTVYIYIYTHTHTHIYTYIEWRYKNIPLNLFHQICILLSYYTHKLQATYFVIHISINVCSVGYFSHATLPNVVGLCADRISSIIQPFQYKLAMANWGGQYLQRICESKPTIMQQICTGCMLIPKALDKYGWCNFFTLLIKHLFTIYPHMLLL